MAMTQEKIRQTSEDMLYLIACILHEVTPDEKKVSDMDLEYLYQVSDFHTLTAIVCMALEKTDAFDKLKSELKRKWQEAKNKAIRKNILLDVERIKLLSWMEEKEIWHMPLKGSILKEFYPKVGMRQMSDNDILFDKDYRSNVWEYMIANGYEASHGVNDDVYKKLPVYNFELHVSLFGELHNSDWTNYYENIKSKLILTDVTSYEYHFTDDDFYIYMMVHGYKHYDGGGIGIRSLVDCYVYNKIKGNVLNREYIEGELEKLGISLFEKETRILAEKLFSNPNQISLKTLTMREQEILEYYIFSGTYGTKENLVRKKLENINSNEETASIKTKGKYLAKRVFPDRKMMKCWCEMNYPFFVKHGRLMPIAYIWRIVHGIVRGYRHIVKEIRIVWKIK